MAGETTETARQSGAQQLYARTEVLSAQRHRDFGLLAQGSFEFARQIVSVPATLSEIVLAQRYFPVVFAGLDRPRPVIVMGLSEAEGNLFVTEDGHWAPRTYVPAFLRRYPFVVVPNGEDRMALAADMDSGLLKVNGARPLFERDTPTDVARRAFDFCARLDADFRAGQDFADALSEAELLREESATVKEGGEVRARLANFRIVDEARFDALPDETVLDWRGRGWLVAVHAHLMSVSSWSELVHRAADRAAAD